MQWSAEYRPGGSILIIAGQRVVLLPAHTPEDMTHHLWDLVQDEAGILDLLDALSSHGLPAVPDAAVAVEDQDGCVVLLKGRMVARSDAGVVDSTGRYTWTETQVLTGEFQLLADPSAAHTPDEEGEGSASWLPIRSGVVLCDRIRLTRGHVVGSLALAGSAPEPRDEEQEPAVPGMPLGAPLEDESPSESTDVAAEAVDSGAILTGEPPTVASAEIPVDPGTAGLDLDEIAPAETEPELNELAVAEVVSEAEPVDEAAPEPEAEPEPELELELEPAPVDEVAAEDEAEDDYDRLFGATGLIERQVRVPAPPAADPVIPEGAAEVQAPAGPAPAPTEQAGADMHHEPSPLAPVPSGQFDGGMLIDAVPGMEAAAPGPDAGEGAAPPRLVFNPSPQVPRDGPPGPLVGGSLGDHDGHTILRPSRSREPSVPSVRAIVCAQGHANPPEAVACRVCALDIGDVPIQTIARPTMGALRLVEPVQGAPVSVDLVRSTILGRKPHHTAGMDPGDGLVAVDPPGGELSRNHLRVTLEGWHILVTDLGSTNGTVITVPGNAPIRLRGGHATPIPAGTIITMAETVSYRFEAG